MMQLNKSISGWQTVLIGLLVAPVFVLNAQPFQPPQHHSNLIFAIQFPQYIMLHHHQRHTTTNNAKNLETLNSRSNDDSNHNVMVNAVKPVDTIHKMQRIEEQLQQKQEPTNYIDLVAKNKIAFFDEDGNKMRPHGQRGNVLSRQFIDGNAAIMLKKNPTVTTMMAITGNIKNVAKSLSFAEQLINNLAANNVAVNFSQSTSPNVQLPFNPQGTEYSLDGRTSDGGSEKYVGNIFHHHQPQVIIINGPTRIYGAGTESKFPPFFEFFVQRIQKYFSVYKYEDLSRPELPSQIAIDLVNSGNLPEALTTSPLKQTTKTNSLR